MDFAEYLPFITDVLQKGAANGLEIPHDTQSNGPWDTLYLASRSSKNAAEWRVLFGQSENHGAISILSLGIRVLNNQADSPQPNANPAETASIVKLIANCCANNDPNRRVVIHAGGLLSLIRLLLNGADPNILVPTIYNVCVDIEDPAETIRPSKSSEQKDLDITIAEERLARTDIPTNSIYAGVIAFLKPEIIQRCDDEIKDYLSDLVEMSARPAVAVQEGLVDARGGDFGFPISRLLAADGGMALARYSLKSRVSVMRSLIAICTSSASKEFLASTGTIFEVAQVADNQFTDPTPYEDEDDFVINWEALAKLQAATLKLVYEVCQMPQFIVPPKYGIARKSLTVVCDSISSSPYLKSVAYIMLYNFIDSDIRAGLLNSESLASHLIQTLLYEKDKMIIHPALGVATKLAVTWSLRRSLQAEGAMQAVQHLLLDANLGYEIPLNTITFLELMVKGHPEHVAVLSSLNGNSSIMLDVFVLFGKGQEAICLEISRLFIEICATLAQQNSADPAWIQISLEAFLGSYEKQQWANILIFATTKSQTADPMTAQRIWFAMGLLSASPVGKHILLLALQDQDVRQLMQTIQAQPESWAAQNVKFMLYSLRDVADEIELDQTMQQMTLQ